MASLTRNEQMLCCGMRLHGDKLRQFWSKLDGNGQPIGDHLAYNQTVYHAHPGEVWAFASNGIGVALEGEEMPLFVRLHPNRTVVNTMQHDSVTAYVHLSMLVRDVMQRNAVIDALLQTLTPLRTIYQNSTPEQRLALMEQLVQFFNLDETPPVWKVGDWVSVAYPEKNIDWLSVQIVDVYFDLVKVKTHDGYANVPIYTLTRIPPPAESGIDKTDVLS